MYHQEVHICQTQLMGAWHNIHLTTVTKMHFVDLRLWMQGCDFSILKSPFHLSLSHTHTRACASQQRRMEIRSLRMIHTFKVFTEEWKNSNFNWEIKWIILRDLQQLWLKSPNPSFHRWRTGTKELYITCPTKHT